MFIIGLGIGLFLGFGIGIWLMSQPQERAVIEVGLKKNLPTHTFVTFEWLYCRLELSPKDMTTLRHILELYDEEGVILTKYNYATKTDEYKLAVNTLI